MHGYILLFAESAHHEIGHGVVGHSEINQYFFKYTASDALHLCQWVSPYIQYNELLFSRCSRHEWLNVLMCKSSEHLRTRLSTYLNVQTHFITSGIIDLGGTINQVVAETWTGHKLFIPGIRCTHFRKPGQLLFILHVSQRLDIYTLVGSQSAWSFHMEDIYL